MKVLVMGLPGSGKSSLAKMLLKKLNDQGLKIIRFDADQVREMFQDWDFSKDARIRSAKRMKALAGMANWTHDIVIVDFVCPTYETRSIFKADFTIWMNTISAGRYEDTNSLFEPPHEERTDYVVEDWNLDDMAVNIASMIEESFRKTESSTKVSVEFLYR